MSIFDKTTVSKVADLARLYLSEDELSRFASQVGNVLGYIEKLNTLETEGVEPLLCPIDVPTPLRADNLVPSPGAETMLSVAPESLYDSYKIPQVLGGGN